MRWRSGLLTTAFLLLATACAPAELPEPKPNLALEYFQAAATKDNQPGEYQPGNSPADRIGDWTTRSAPEVMDDVLLRARDCLPDKDCQVPNAVSEAVRAFTEGRARLWQRSILVKRADGSMELLTLFVARTADRRTRVIDTSGQVYSGVLDDFRRENGLLDSDDVIRAPRDLADVNGRPMQVVTLTGSTAPVVPSWVYGAGGVLLVLGGVLLWRRMRHRPRPPGFTPDGPNPA